MATRALAAPPPPERDRAITCVGISHPRALGTACPAIGERSDAVLRTAMAGHDTGVGGVQREHRTQTSSPAKAGDPVFAAHATALLKGGGSALPGWRRLRHAVATLW